MRTAHWDKNSPCWLWPGHKNRNGYGIVDREDEEYFAHRLIYKMFVGKLIKGLCVLHICDNPSCVNPAHLRQGTWAENNRDRAAKGRSGKRRALKTHCKRGHPLDGDNVYYRELKGGSINRNCKACLRERYQERKKAVNE